MEVKAGVEELFTERCAAELSRTVNEKLKLERALDSCENQIVELKSQLAISEQELNSSNLRLEKLREEVNSKEVQVEICTKNEIEGLKKQIALFENEYAQVHAEIDAREARVAEFARAMSRDTEGCSSDRVLQALVGAQGVPKLLGRLEAIDKDLASKDETLERLQKVLDNSISKSDFEAVCAERDSLSEDFKALLTVEQSLRTKVDVLSKTNEDAKAKIIAFEADIKSKRDILAAQSVQIKEQAGMIERLEQAGSWKDRELGALEYELTARDNQLVALDQSCLELEQQLLAMQNDHFAEVQDLTNYIDGLVYERDNLFREVESLQRYIDRMNTDFAGREAYLQFELNKAQSDVKKTKAELRAFERKLENSEIELLEAKMELVRTQGNLSKVTDRSNELEHLVNDLEHRLRLTAEKLVDAQQKSSESAGNVAFYQAESERLQKEYTLLCENRDQQLSELRLAFMGSELMRGIAEAERSKVLGEVEAQKKVQENLRAENLKSRQAMEKQIQDMKKDMATLKHEKTVAEHKFEYLSRKKSLDLQPATQLLISLEMEREELRRQRTRAHGELAAGEQRQNNLFRTVDKLRKQVSVAGDEQNLSISNSRSNTRKGNSLLRVVTFGMFGGGKNDGQLGTNERVFSVQK